MTPYQYRTTRFDLEDDVDDVDDDPDEDEEDDEDPLEDDEEDDEDAEEPETWQVAAGRLNAWPAVDFAGRSA